MPRDRRPHAKARDEDRSYMARLGATLANATDLALTIPQQARLLLQHVNFQGHHLYGGKVTLLFESVSREQAVSLLEFLPPIPLTMVQMKNRRKPIWASTYDGGTNAHNIVSRMELVPFLFGVKQGLQYAAKAQLSWLTRVKDDYASIEVDILEDPARFDLTPNDAVFPAAMRWRWERNGHWPWGHTRGLWGVWMERKGEIEAYCTVYWPLSVAPKHAMRDAVSMGKFLLLGGSQNEKT